MNKSRWSWLQFPLVFLVALAGLTLTSWNGWKQPSPHFHFTDLAQSFLAGRLDTLTPFRSHQAKGLPDDPEGLQEAINRVGHSGRIVQWNDWVSYYELVLESGEHLKGVWPWKWRKKGERGFDIKDRFVTLSGDWLPLSPSEPLSKACVERPESARKDPEARKMWDTAQRHDAEREACAGESVQGSRRGCEEGAHAVKCQHKRYFISFPPFPAVAILPFVALWHYHFNDVIFTLLLAALNAVLLLLLLRKLRDFGYIERSDQQLWVLVGLFVFGTVAFFSSIRGEVWFTALVMGVTLHLAYLYFAFDLRHPLLAGVFLSLGFATRTPLLFASSFFFLLVLLQKDAFDRAGWWKRVKQVVWFSVPCLVVGGLLMAYNLARFESPFEFGHRYLQDGTRQSIVDHGMFSAWFLSRNLAALFTNLPQFTSEFPYVKITGHGLALFAVTPVFFYLLWPKKSPATPENPGRYRLSVHAILWIAVAFTALPGLLYQNSGWFQFAYRFAMDYLPMLMVLLAMDRRRWNWLFYALVGLSVAMNLFGAITFNRFPMFYY